MLWWYFTYTFATEEWKRATSESIFRNYFCGVNAHSSNIKEIKRGTLFSEWPLTEVLKCISKEHEIIRDDFQDLWPCARIHLVRQIPKATKNIRFTNHTGDSQPLPQQPMAMWGYKSVTFGVGMVERLLILSSFHF